MNDMCKSLVVNSNAVYIWKARKVKVSSMICHFGVILLARGPGGGWVVIRGLVIRSRTATFLCSRRAMKAAANTQPSAACVDRQRTPGPIVFAERMQEMKEDLQDIQTKIQSFTNGFSLIPNLKMLGPKPPVE